MCGTHQAEVVKQMSDQAISFLMESIMGTSTQDFGSLAPKIQICLVTEPFHNLPCNVFTITIFAEIRNMRD